MTNEGVNRRSKMHGGAGPKSTTDGKSIKPHAKNTVMVLGHNPPELSPSSTANSRSQKK